MSVREYQPKAVSRGLLEKLVDAARRAPTARGVEPWEFIVVTDKGNLQKIAQLAENGRFIKDASCCIVIFCQDTKYYLEDGCAATENILLAAEDLGLGACWVAGDKKPYCREVALLLEAPPNFKLVSLIAVGWPSKEHLQKKKRKLEEVIHWEKF